MLLGCLVLAQVAEARQARNGVERRAFMRENPCPATGQQRGKCPGWIVDHIVPICAGGLDRRDNMQWQTVEDAKRKDRDERRECRKGSTKIKKD